MIFTLLSAFCRLLQDDLIVQKCFVRYCFAMDHIQQHLTGSPSQLCDIELQRGYGNRIIFQNAAVMTGCHLHLVRDAYTHAGKLSDYLIADVVILTQNALHTALFSSSTAFSTMALLLKSVYTRSWFSLRFPLR